MKGLLIAEKPSVMKAIKEVYMEKGGKGYAFDLDFGAFHGHLMELKMPEDYDASLTWSNTAALPIIPAKFEYKAADPESVKKLLSVIKGKKYDFLINACDAGREGEHIFWSFYESQHLTLPVKRFWASSVTKPALRQALSNLQDAHIYDGMRQAAKYRAQFDWLVGMNFTRIVTYKQNHLASVGRVQTPTLKLIVDRELAIQNFVPQNFFEVKAVLSINGQDGNFVHVFAPAFKESRFAKKEEADAVLKAVKQAKTGNVANVAQTVKKIDAPTLYSLTELQKDANKYYKFKPDKTLEIAQKLYEAGLLTYPRTESRYLPTDMIPEIPAHIAPLKAVPDIAGHAASIQKPQVDAMLHKNIYIDDAGITDHHAIIPTDQIPTWGNLSKEEQQIYTLVGKSFLAIFMPPYTAKIITVLVNIGGYMFRAQGKIEMDVGYGALYTNKKSPPVLVPDCKRGDSAVLSKGSVTKGTTKPPVRYSPKTILAAMQNAGQDLPDSAMRSILKESAGLGTPATRADILEKLEKRGYVEVKSNAYYALEKGIEIIREIGQRTFASPALTAQWEEKLSGMEKGTYKGDFRQEMEAYIKEESAHLLGNVRISNGQIGKCPLCGKPFLIGGNSYYCAGFKDKSCNLSIGKVIKGTTLSESDIQTLLQGGQTQPLNFTWKNGKQGQAKLSLNGNSLQWEFLD